MHFNSLLHVRDHSKVQGTAHHLLEYIALHVNQHTGEAFELTVERLAHRLDVTPQWVGQLRRRLVESGELLVQQSRGRHANVYRIPWERCPACQARNPKGELRIEDPNPKVHTPQPQSEPQSPTPPTPNGPQANPKVAEPSTPPRARIATRKDLKDLKERKDGATPNSIDDPSLDKPERQSPFWCEACGVAIPTCVHRVVYGPEDARGVPRPGGRGDRGATGRLEGVFQPW